MRVQDKGPNKNLRDEDIKSDFSVLPNGVHRCSVLARHCCLPLTGIKDTRTSECDQDKVATRSAPCLTLSSCQT